MLCSACGVSNQDDASVCASCGRGLGPGDFAQGAVVAGRFEILSVLGRGGMGVVYEARDRSLDEVVALKLIREEVGAPELAARFRSEIKLARRVQHRNVCSIFGDGEHSGRLFLCLERIEGTDLKRQIKERGALPPAEAFDVAIQAAEGLGAIHAASIVHRDLKTANLMRDSGGRVVVMDFGLARRSGDGLSGGVTQTGHVVGTPDYMSPEQARDEPLSPATDVYSLGIIVYELFTGERPFTGDTPVSAMVRRLTEPPPLERAVARGLPQALVPVLKKALSIAPDQRYANGTVFAQALRAAQELKSEANRPPASSSQTISAVTTPREPAHRRRVGWVAAALFLLAGLALFTRGPSSARPAAPGPLAPSPETPSGSTEPGFSVQAVDCILTDHFTDLRLGAPNGLDPGARPRLYFQSNLSPEWFFTLFKRNGDSWQAFLPKINKGGGIREISYYAGGIGEEPSETLKTATRTAQVINQASECPAGGRVGAVDAPREGVSVLLASPGQDLALPIADAFGFQTLQEGLKDPDPAVRSATAKSLTEMADLIAAAIGDAVKRLHSEDAGDRLRAGDDLERTGRQAVRGTVEALIALLNDQNPRTRRSVAPILGSLGQTLARARSALSAALRDANNEVRVSATRALAAMGSVVTTTLAALRSAGEREDDDETAEALLKARRLIEDSLSAPEAPKK